MAWDEVAKRINPKIRQPCKIGLSRKDENSRTVLRISLSPELVAKLGWAASSGLALAVGSGPDAGRLRIKGTDNGNAVAKLHQLKWAAICNFGHVEALGALPRVLLAADHMVDDGVLFVTLPTPWPVRADGDVEQEPDDPAPASAGGSEPRQRPGQIPPWPPSREPDSAMPLIVMTNDGVAVRVTPPSFRASDTADWVDCVTMDAKVLVPLVRSLNQIISREIIAKAVYAPKQPPAGAGDTITAVLNGLRPRLDKAGLKLTNTKGIGYTLARQ